MRWIFICGWLLLQPLTNKCQIYCQDTSTCTSGAILASGSVFCQEDKSCSYSEGTTSITSTGGYIYCNADYSCYGGSTFLISAYYDIYCRSRYSCAYASLSTYGNAYCNGYNSCRYAKISSLYRLYCYSGYSCEWATITGVQYVYGRSYYSLQHSSIYSTGLTTLYVELYAYQSGYGSYIYCDLYDTCHIYCAGTGCEYVNLVCSGTCYVYCDESKDTICPNGYLGPTEVPTSQPSKIPTITPTLQPSNIPTDQPIIVTLDPTNSPTNIPTDLPIIQPTETPSDTMEVICTTQCDDYINSDQNDNITDSNGLNENDNNEINLDFVSCLIETANIYVVACLIILFLISLCINIVLISKNGSLKLSMRTIEKMHSQSQMSLQNINVINDNDENISQNTAILRTQKQKNIQMVSIKSSTPSPVPQNTSTMDDIVENEDEDEDEDEDENEFPNENEFENKNENENISGLPKLNSDISASVHEGEVKPQRLQQLKTRIYKRTMSDPEVELMFEPAIPTYDGFQTPKIDVTVKGANGGSKLPPPKPKRTPKPPPKPKSNNSEEGNEEITGDTPSGEFMD